MFVVVIGAEAIEVVAWSAVVAIEAGADDVCACKVRLAAIKQFDK